MEKYKVLDLEKYYRKGVYKHFTNDCKCSISITNKIDVTKLIAKSKETNTKFYINFLYLLACVMNSRDDYKMVYDWQKNRVLVYDKVNITHYVFNENTETCTPVYTKYTADYQAFYKECQSDMNDGKNKGGYNLDSLSHPNYFEASYISWLSYESLHIELPDGYLYYQPVINWGRYSKENDKFLMPVTVRLNHAVADGYLVSKVFLLLEEKIRAFCEN